MSQALRPDANFFVKLWQFDMADRQHVNIDTHAQAFETAPDRIGVSILPLYSDRHETVRLERYEPGSGVSLSDPGGLELLLLTGSFDLDTEQFVTQSWMRLPNGDRATIKVGDEGATVWIKSGHLSQTPQAPSI
jgi:hypothetical protein